MPAPASSSSSIVVADACAWGRKRVRELLNAAGHRRVYEAADGAEAVGLLEAAAPTLLVVDWNLPVVGAPELVQLARGARREGGEPLPIILTITDPRDADIRRAMDAGLTNIVVKPFSARLMRARLTGAGAHGARADRSRLAGGPAAA